MYGRLRWRTLLVLLALGLWITPARAEEQFCAPTGCPTGGSGTVDYLDTIAEVEACMEGAGPAVMCELDEDTAFDVGTGIEWDVAATVESLVLDCNGSRFVSTSAATVTGTFEGTSTATSWVDTGAFTSLTLSDYRVVVLTGTGSDIGNIVTSHTNDALTVPDVGVTPDATSTYEIEPRGLVVLDLRAVPSDGVAKSIVLRDCVFEGSTAMSGEVALFVDSSPDPDLVLTLDNIVAEEELGADYETALQIRESPGASTHTANTLIDRSHFSSAGLVVNADALKRTPFTLRNSRIRGVGRDQATNPCLQVFPYGGGTDQYELFEIIDSNFADCGGVYVSGNTSLGAFQTERLMLDRIGTSTEDAPVMEVAADVFTVHVNITDWAGGTDGEFYNRLSNGQGRIVIDDRACNYLSPTRAPTLLDDNGSFTAPIEFEVRAYGNATTCTATGLGPTITGLSATNVRGMTNLFGTIREYLGSWTPLRVRSFGYLAGAASTAGCFFIGDSDGAGTTECNALNGVLSCRADTDGLADCND